MRRPNGYIWMSLVGILVLILLVAGCKVGSLKTLSPVQPPRDTESGEYALPEEIVLEADNPKFFKVPARTPILTMEKDDIIVSIAYWRRTDLDRKYNRGSAVSPFYEREALHQGEKTDVFYVKITNNRPEKIIFRINHKDLMLADQGENWYGPLDFKHLRERLLLMTRVTGLHIKNGLEIARGILIEKQLGKLEDGILPGKSIEGFLPFYQLKLNAKTLDVIIPIEKAPPPGTAARYKTIEFRFPFTHSRLIRLAQPSPQRY